jgi:AmmeMemoRadiSam system protein B/AmmeMemoRadiSam system protein A
MKKVKSPSVAGSFYPGTEKELSAEIATFIKNSRFDYNCSARAVIVPHAGYFFSGQLACEGIQYLNPKAQNVFVIAPAHQVLVRDLAISSYGYFATPLGEIPVNQEINKILVEKFKASFQDKAFAVEHSVEVQLPLVQSFLPNASIIPILTGDTDPQQIKDLLEYFWDDEETAFVISSDLSHFFHDTEARKIDKLTAEMIETANIDDFNPRQACGSTGIIGLVDFAKDRDFSMIRVNLQNSSVVGGDKLRVVGYGSWIMFEGSKEKFIKDNFSELIIDVCKKSIKTALDTGRALKIKPEDYPFVLQQNGASFVTLEIDEVLRGCIGSIIEHQPLIADIVQNAYNSAFSDSRFSPLDLDEYKLLSISVSLLSAPHQMFFKDEQDLLSQIVQDVDGIIIRDGYHQAVYLPSVWEQLPDKILFLNSLKQKAGLPASYFSKNFEAYRFRTEYIKGKV